MRGTLQKHVESEEVATKPKLAHQDNRSKLDLELFLIALIQREINTPYSLQVKAGLSPGATIPVLKRLETVGYVQRGVSGPRGRTEYQVTAKGIRYFTKSWRPLLDGPPPPDIESIFRIVGLAVMSGADLSAVSAFLRRAARRKATDAADREAAAARREPLNSEPWETDFYACLQARYAGSRLLAESKFLRRLATLLLTDGD